MKLFVCLSLFLFSIFSFSTISFASDGLTLEKLRVEKTMVSEFGTLEVKPSIKIVSYDMIFIGETRMFICTNEIKALKTIGKSNSIPLAQYDYFTYEHMRV